MIEVLLQAESALSIGLLDRAEILYRQVAIADPRNSIAVVGLARVALERGDEGGALALARRALGIDPENDAAKRLAARLVDVIETRTARALPSEAAGSSAGSTGSSAEAAGSSPETAGSSAEAAGSSPETAGTRTWLGRLLRRDR